MIFVNSCPAAPTNGSPCASSSAPGASPTNISDAFVSPTPNTTFCRALARFGHFIQTNARSRSSANAADFAAGSSAADAGNSVGAGPGWLGGDVTTGLGGGGVNARDAGAARRTGGGAVRGGAAGEVLRAGAFSS